MAMRRKYVLVDTDKGQARSIAELLDKTPGITAAIITGPDEVIAMLDVPDACSLDSSPLRHIRAMEGVKDVTPCFAAEGAA